MRDAKISSHSQAACNTSQRSTASLCIHHIHVQREFHAGIYNRPFVHAPQQAIQSLCLKKSGLEDLGQAYISASCQDAHSCQHSSNRLNALYKFQGMNKLKNSDRGALGCTIQQVGKKTWATPTANTQKACCRTYLTLWLSVLMDQVSIWMSANNQNSLHVKFVPGLTCKALVHMTVIG